jgi:DUF971 family protein
MPHWDRADAVPEPAWPREIRVKDGGARFEVDFQDGTAFSLSAEYLRVESPSAEVQGHGPGQRQFVTGVTDVTIVAVEPVGNYAVRLCFSDGHDTGLYSWTYLYELGRDRAQRWQKYLDGLAKAGRAR